MRQLLAILAASAFANTNAASKLFVCATPQNSPLAEADYEALDWTEVANVGSMGETGKSTNILNYDTWNDTVVQKAKGMTDAGSPEVECARNATDPGQLILKAAGDVGNNNNYAFMELRSDAPIGGTGTKRFNRGLVAGPKYPGGRNEDFDLIVFTLAFQQAPIEVAATVGGVPPTLTVNPAITGTAEVGEDLTLSNGTFTGDPTITYAYAWFAGGVKIQGAITNTFELTAAQVGKVITARVTATNASGSASGYSAATTAVSA